MKKFVFFLAAFTAMLCALSFGSINTRGMIKTGTNCPDFILGMKGTTVYSLSDFFGKGNIILAFMDNGMDSEMFKKLISGAMGKIPGKNNIWFNITYSSGHAVIEAVSGGLGIRYRTLKTNIPKIYTVPCYPSILIMDRAGVVQFIYVGYSPTVIGDISNWLEKNR
jgi:hypothetical protein